MTTDAQDLARATVMLDLKRYGEAASLLAHVVAGEPADSRAWCLLATAHLGMRQYQEAADAARRAITFAPSDDWPYRLASIADRHLRNDMAALTAATEAVKLAPNHWRAYTCLAQAELARGYDGAARAAARARELAPDEPDVHFVSGLISYARYDFQAARDHQERALALNPGHSGAVNELGRIELRRHSQAGAVGHFIRAARSAPAERVFGRNVYVAIHGAVVVTIYMASMTSIMLLCVAMIGHLPLVTVVAGLGACAALGAGIGAVQLWRMPPEARPLFRTRRVALALGMGYGSIFIVAVAAAVAPATALTGTLAAGTGLIFATLVAVVLILRWKPKQVKALRSSTAKTTISR
jgi:tetratricopeptide (TPR) repeat protein